MKPIVLIDYENVGAKYRKAHIPEFCDVRIFSRLPIAVMERKRGKVFPHDVTFIEVRGNTPNAVDFHISMEVGMLFEQDTFNSVQIVSNDKGFDGLIDYLASKGALVHRTSIPDERHKQ